MIHSTARSIRSGCCTRVGGKLAKVAKRVKEQGIALELTDASVDWLLKEGYNPKFGARPIRRTIETEGLYHQPSLYSDTPSPITTGSIEAVSPLTTMRWRSTYGAISRTSSSESWSMRSVLPPLLL